MKLTRLATSEEAPQLDVMNGFAVAALSAYLPNGTALLQVECIL